VVTGTNIENASYGMTLCAETVAVSKAMADGARGGLEAVAGTGPKDKGGDDPITPCGRCRQMLNELAQLGGTDPEILCVGPADVKRVKLSALLPDAFGPASLE
jgi:cytidine deaminase